MAAKHKHRRSQKRVTLKRLWGHLGLRIRRNQVPVLNGSGSVQEFRAILDRERARANRNGHEFSLVVFDPGNVKHSSAYARYVAHVVSRRVRATDEIGWFDERRIGLALPYTGPKGALKVASDVCETISIRALSPGYTVYTYPSQWMKAGDKPEPLRRFAGISP